MAGVTRGAQVHHFGSKNDLVIAALQHLAAKRAAAVVANIGDLTATENPGGKLLDLLWDVHEGPLFIAAVELWVAGGTDAALGREVAKFESIVASNLMAAVAEFVPDMIQKPMRDFLYTAMDALRGILIASSWTPTLRAPGGVGTGPRRTCDPRGTAGRRMGGAASPRLNPLVMYSLTMMGPEVGGAQGGKRRPTRSTSSESG